MRRNGFQLWNFGKWRAKMLHVLSMGRTFLFLIAGSMIFFVLLGLGGVAEQKLNSSPVSSMKGFAGSLSSRFFIDMLGMELPNMNKEKGESTFSGEKMTTFMFQMLTSVNPKDPKSLLAREMPGMNTDQSILLRSGSGNKNMDAPEDFHLPSETEEDDNATKPDDQTAQHDDQISQQRGQTVTPNEQPAKGDTSSAKEVKEPEPGAKKDPGGQKPPQTNGKGGTPAAKDKAVLIYHSHPRESYNPLLGKTSDNPSSKSPSQNVMLVGSYLAKKLETLGVGTIHSEKDYPSIEPDYNYNYSYKYSRQTVKQAMTQNSGIKYIFDIHRDSQPHSKTTAVINGKNYAKVFFIIGHGNNNWRENEAFANSIHERLEKSYPGISLGIWGKTSANGNGEYNQSLSPNSILIEVGGIDSTNDELKRTAEVLADIVADLYYKDQKAQKASTAQGNDGTKAGSTN